MIMLMTNSEIIVIVPVQILIEVQKLWWIICTGLSLVEHEHSFQQLEIPMQFLFLWYLYDHPFSCYDVCSELVNVTFYLLLSRHNSNVLHRYWLACGIFPTVVVYGCLSRSSMRNWWTCYHSLQYLYVLQRSMTITPEERMVSWPDWTKWPNWGC